MQHGSWDHEGIAKINKEYMNGNCSCVEVYEYFMVL